MHLYGFSHYPCKMADSYLELASSTDGCNVLISAPPSKLSNTSRCTFLLGNMGDIGTIFFFTSVEEHTRGVLQSTVSVLSNSSGGGGKSVGGGGNSKSANVGGGTDREGLPPRNELCGPLKVRKLDRILSVLFLEKYIQIASGPNRLLRKLGPKLPELSNATLLITT